MVAKPQKKMRSASIQYHGAAKRSQFPDPPTTADRRHRPPFHLVIIIIAVDEAGMRVSVIFEVTILLIDDRSFPAVPSLHPLLRHPTDRSGAFVRVRPLALPPDPPATGAVSGLSPTSRHSRRRRRCFALWVVIRALGFLVQRAASAVGFLVRFC